ncbi:AraC family ligand binding domain-containing protein [Pedobacter steynii]
MKVLPFTILVPDDRSVISEYIEMAHFYPHLHRHDEWQITFIERGEGTLITGSEMHAFKAGDIFVIGSKMPHLLKVILIILKAILS